MFIVIITIIIKNALNFRCFFLRRAHSTEQTPFTRVYPPGTHFTVESTDAMRIKCLPQGLNILMLPGFEPSIAVSIDRHLAHVTNMLYIDISN